MGEGGIPAGSPHWARGSQLHTQAPPAPPLPAACTELSPAPEWKAQDTQAPGGGGDTGGRETEEGPQEEGRERKGERNWVPGRNCQKALVRGTGNNPGKSRWG